MLESIPAELARNVTARLDIPTIGIGAGPDCDGQILVSNDMLGLTAGRTPSFVKLYARISDTIDTAVRAYADDVRSGAFPDEEHSYR